MAPAARRFLCLLVVTTLGGRASAQQPLTLPLFGDGRKVVAAVVPDDRGGRVLELSERGRAFYSEPLKTRGEGRIRLEARRVPALPGPVIVVTELYLEAYVAQAVRVLALAATGRCSVAPLFRFDASETEVDRLLDDRLSRVDGPPARQGRGSGPVDASEDWQVIGGVVACAGDEVEITARGAWSIGPGLETATADGYDLEPPRNEARLDRTAPAGVLLCRCGGGRAFAVGRSGSFKAATDGAVECRINDRTLEDNAGRLTVEVRISD